MKKVLKTYKGSIIYDTDNMPFDRDKFIKWLPNNIKLWECSDLDEKAFEMWVDGRITSFWI